jgi:hypothetical protein
MNTTSPYHATTQHTFRQAIVYLLETEYKLVGSHRVIQMIADDVVELQAEYYCDADEVPPGYIVWRGTLDGGHKPAVGRRAEDEPTVTAVLPLITDGDVVERAQGRPACSEQAQTAFAFSGRGEVYSYSPVYHAPRRFEEFAPLYRGAGAVGGRPPGDRADYRRGRRSGEHRHAGGDGDAQGAD